MNWLVKIGAWLVELYILAGGIISIVFFIFIGAIILALLGVI